MIFIKKKNGSFRCIKIPSFPTKGVVIPTLVYIILKAWMKEEKLHILETSL
jgi:hypothetical protein